MQDSNTNPWDNAKSIKNAYEIGMLRTNREE